MRRFVIVGQTATASSDFSLNDVAGTSGRLDILLRCLRAGLLVSHGLRADSVVYLVLLGGPMAPRTLRVEGSCAKYLRADERNLGGLIKSVLALPEVDEVFGFSKPGVSVARGGLDIVLRDMGPVTPFVLEEGAPDVRGCSLDVADPAFFVGDHLGFDEATREALRALGATPISVGPVSLHADDAITLVSNELDRREARR